MTPYPHDKNGDSDDDDYDNKYNRALSNNFKNNLKFFRSHDTHIHSLQT